ncbi:MAG: 3'-5' exonuclease, partial [Pseudomonadota bacterium]
LKQIMEAENVDLKAWPPRVLMSVIQRWKDRGLTPDKLSRADAGDLAGGRLNDIYKQYQERLKTLNACDFGDLLLHMLAIFQDPAHAEALQGYHRQFKYILVDEYQDTNVAQYLWLRLLAQASKNICCVGDDDQSIYGWRGAEVGNILRFEEDFPGAAIIRLEENYRSTSHILACATGVIANNNGRLGKTLWTAADGGEKVRVRQVWDGEEEARWVGDEVEALQAKGQSLADMAVLVRAGFQTREFEERFITLGVPYVVVGGARFYERQEIRDALAYLRVVVQPADDLAFERIINKPKRGIGAKTLQNLQMAAREMGVPLAEATWRMTENGGVKGKTATTLRGLMEDFARWRSLIETEDHGTLVKIILEESGYTRMWMEDKSPEAPGRLENLKELVSAIEEFDSLIGFLEHVSLVMENQENADGEAITLMTLHGAKGLEFDTVFLPGWEEGVFPNQRAMDESGVAGLEEERRLAYVGITRARKLAIITHAGNRRIHGSWTSSLPSRFVEELPPENVDVDAEAPAAVANQSWGHGFSGRADWSQVGQEPSQSAERLRAAINDARKRPPPPVLSPSYTVPDRPRPNAAFQAGERVFHDKFGYGTVIGSDNDKVRVKFDHSGDKKLMDNFLKPAGQA